MSFHIKKSAISDLSFLSESDSSPNAASSSSSPTTSQYLNYKKNSEQMKESFDFSSESEFIVFIDQSSDEVPQSQSSCDNSSSYYKRFNSSWIRII